MTIPEQLRAARIALGWNHQNVADATGFARSQVSQYENGTHQPTIHGLCRWARALGFDVTLTPIRAPEKRMCVLCGDNPIGEGLQRYCSPECALAARQEREKARHRVRQGTAGEGVDPLVKSHIRVALSLWPEPEHAIRALDLTDPDEVAYAYAAAKEATRV